MIVDEAGNHKQQVHNGEKYVKSRSWHVTLVPSDDPEKVKVAKWLFDTYANQDVGLRHLVNDLNRRGVPGPRGDWWHVGTVRELLATSATPATSIGRNAASGSITRIRAAGTEIRAARRRRCRVVFNDESEQIRHKGIFPALVDRATWERVQVKLTERRDRKTPFKSKKMIEHYLSGLVFCAECGAKMHGQQTTRRKNGKVYHYAKYICASYHTKGKHACGAGSINQAALLAVLLEKLRDAVLAGGHRETMRARIIERLQAQRAAGPVEAEGLRAALPP